jgi:hypothetical protein
MIAPDQGYTTVDVRRVNGVTQFLTARRRCFSMSGEGRPMRTWRNIVNVITVARSIGLAADERGDVSGTVDQDVVLAAISELSGALPGNEDLFADAAMRVQLARSAGVEQLDPKSALNRSSTAATVQLRYRSEMADVFTDLAIDVGIREAGRFADTPA